MIISGKKLLEILEEFKNSNPKKEERIAYEEWRNLVKFLTKSQETEFSVTTDTPILKLHETQTGYDYRFIVGSYFLNFFKSRTIDYKISVTSSTPPTINDPTPSTTESSKNLNENLSKGSSNKMNLSLNNLFDFGPINDDVVMYSPYGLAFRNSHDQYFTYNPTTKKTTDVTGLTIDLKGLIYQIPVGLNSVKPGDIIVHNGKPVCVEGIENHSVICVDIENSELKTVIPPTNIFGFNYVTKITPLFNLGSMNPSEDNPFGNIMPYLLFSTLAENGSAGASGNGFDIQTLLLMSLLNGNADGNFFGNIFGNGQA